MPPACRTRSYSSTCQSWDSIWVVSGLNPMPSSWMNAREIAGQSTSGSAARCADQVPVAPENLARYSDAPTWAATRSRRHTNTASSLPIVVGVAGWPCVRESIAASRCCSASARSESMTACSLGSHTPSMARWTVSAYEAELMSSLVHAKCVSSAIESRPSAESRSRTRYSTAFTS